MKMDPTFKTIDQCISTYPPDVQAVMQKIRKTIHKAAPGATEKISYGIPTFYLNGNLVHFSAYKSHIGFYPGAAPISEFKDKLKGYETSKGTIRFPLDKPVPYDLITDITRVAVERNLAKKK